MIAECNKAKEIGDVLGMDSTSVSREKKDKMKKFGKIFPKDGVSSIFI